MNVHANFVKLLIRVMYLLIVKIPVSGSLTGNSFHVNDSAKLIRYSKLWKLSLKHRKIKVILRVYYISVARLRKNLRPLTYGYLNYHT